MKPFPKFLALLLCVSVSCGGSAPSGSADAPDAAADIDAGPSEPDLGGFVIAPPGEDFVPKQSQSEKIANYIANNQVPSSLAGAIVQLTRAFLSGREAQSDLERDAFATLAGLSPQTLAAFTLMVEGIDAMPKETSEKIYDSRFLNISTDFILTAENVGEAFDTELSRRIAIDLNSTEEELCLSGERPGLERTIGCSDIDGTFDSSCNRVCRIGRPGLVQSVRTKGFIPRLSPGDYLPNEVQSDCSANTDGDVICQTVVFPECDGTIGAGNTCLVIPTAQQGQSLTMQGFNFFSVDAEIVLSLVGGTKRVSLPAFVCGDLSSNAEADADCNVNDLVTFTIPTDLAAGRYQVDVVMPNSAGSFASDFRNKPLLDILPSADTRFELVADNLNCLEESGFTSFFSDTIDLTILTTEISPDGSLGGLNKMHLRFNDVDTGEQRSISKTLFSGPLQGTIAMSIIGFEVDGEQAFIDQIDNFQDAFVSLLDGIVGKIGGKVGTAIGAGIGELIGGAIAVSAGAAIGAVVTAAIIATVALWLPADLALEDTDGINGIDFSQRTSLNFPNPEQRKFSSTGGVRVTVEACEDTEERDFALCSDQAKQASEYLERRQYNADSRYELTFRYRRN